MCSEMDWNKNQPNNCIRLKKVILFFLRVSFSLCVCIYMCECSKNWIGAEEPYILLGYGANLCKIRNTLEKKILPDKYATPNVTKIVSNFQVETIKKVLLALISNQEMKREPRRSVQAYICFAIQVAQKQTQLQQIVLSSLLHIFRLLINFNFFVLIRYAILLGLCNVPFNFLHFAEIYIVYNYWIKLRIVVDDEMKHDLYSLIIRFRNLYLFRFVFC